MKKNIVFYCHNFGGLGHTRRISLIIKEILSNFGDFYNVVFLNSGKIQDFLFEDIKGVKIINLPNYNIQDFQIIGGEKIFIYRKKIFKRLFEIGNIEKLVIEHFPFGRNFLSQEINDMIHLFKKYNDRGKVIGSVRDIFQLNSIDSKNMILIDRFLIHADKQIINYNGIFLKDIENKIVYTGYVVDKSKPIINNNLGDYILLNLGGGQDGFEFVEDFLDKFSRLNIDIKIYINLGLNYTDSNLNKINNFKLKNIVIKDYFQNFIELKNNAKIVVSMGGYNSLVENIYYNKTSIIYPRTTDQEQTKRLDVFSKKFSGIYDGRELTSEKLNNIFKNNKNNNKNIFNDNGAFFSASFISNFTKYKYLKIRPTNICNAKCDMCGVIKRKTQSNNYEKLINSIDDFYKIGGEIINFTGGEPTIYNGFWELLEYSKFMGFINSVSTNGSTLGDKFFSKLQKNGKTLIDYIDISVDGLYEKQDKIRSYQGLFEKISSNIKRLAEYNIKVHINVTLRNDNILEAKEIFEYFRHKPINSISFGMIDNSPINDTKRFIPSVQQLKLFYKENKKYILENKGLIKVTFSPDFISGNFEDFLEGIQKELCFDRTPGSHCDFIRSKKELRINEGGNISPCCEIDDFEEGIGNINEKNLLEIICGKSYQNFLNRKFPNISKACLNCKY